mmetsp:Transcript_107568/g.302837  ORF Transcript_107568/g.302837 Transcript_107568/m.302837 type:complete len:580 (-) Transcript_107568:229-1968(-)
MARSISKQTRGLRLRRCVEGLLLVAMFCWTTGATTTRLLAAFAMSSNRGPRTGHRAVATYQTQTTPQAVHALEELKQQLRNFPTKKGVALLEAMSPADVTSITQLRGKWDLLGPKDNRVGWWTSGDLTRMLLGLYQADFGRMLSMELEAAPTLDVAADGSTETRTHLIWGNRRDEISMSGVMTVVRPNVLKDTPRAVRSKVVGLTLPSLQPGRDVRVTYFDGDLLIIRDGRGAADILWRRGATPAFRAPECAGLADAEAPGPRTRGNGVPAQTDRIGEIGTAADSTPDTDGGANNRIEQLVGEIEGLKHELEIQQNQTVQDHAARHQLIGKIAELERSFEAARVESEADAAKLSAMETLEGAMSQQAETQLQKSRDVDLGRRDLEAEVAGVEARLRAIGDEIFGHEAHEASLLDQIALLESTKARAGTREARAGNRMAIAGARKDLKETRNKINTAKKSMTLARRDLTQKSAQLRTKSGKSEVETSAHQRLEEQLAARRRECAEQQDHFSERVAVVEKSRAELEEARAKLAALEAREVEGLQRAAILKGQLKDIATQMNQAQQATKYPSNKRRRFWPFR